MSVQLKGCLPHVCSYLQSLHGHIAAFEKGSYKSPISASAYAVHMREAKQWDTAFRPIYAMGDVPSEFQGSLQPALQHHTCRCPGLLLV